MRLVDADKFILALMDASLSSVDEDTILDLVDSVPTVDAVVVTRCKDCKHYVKYVSNFGDEISACNLFNRPAYDDVFCSYGEPKEDT